MSFRLNLPAKKPRIKASRLAAILSRAGLGLIGFLWTPGLPALCHGRDETDYYGCQMVLRTTDAGASWTELSPFRASTRRGLSLPAESLAIISASCSMARSSF